MSVGGGSTLQVWQQWHLESPLLAFHLAVPLQYMVQQASSIWVQVLVKHRAEVHTLDVQAAGLSMTKSSMIEYGYRKHVKRWVPSCCSMRPSVAVV
jgi:hypothetical protein